MTRDSERSGIFLAGALLVVPFFDLMLGVATLSPVHAIVGFFGFVLLAISGAAKAR